MFTHLSSRISVAAVIVAFAGAAASAQQYTAVIFGPPDAFETVIQGAGNGRQVGSFASEANEMAQHAALWLGPASTLIDLHPVGADSSVAYACGGLQQVGVVFAEGETRAALWTGTAASVVILNPPGFGSVSANGTDGVTQVGSGRGPGTGRGPHALAWTGTAASVVDLNPEGYTNSFASDVDGAWIAGAATTDFGANYAGYWTARSAESWVTLHPTEGFDSTTAEAISGTSIGGHGNGMTTNENTHALLWLDGGTTMLDLHPDGYEASYIYAMRGNVQAGSAVMPPAGLEHAMVWTGTGQSAVDLHDLLPDGQWIHSRVTGIDDDGSLYGYATNGGTTVAVRWIPAPDVCGPADIGGVGGAAGSDGHLDNNDFVVFIDLFFNHAPVADMGGTGGVPGADGVWDNNDFVVFIDHFFAGC